MTKSPKFKSAGKAPRATRTQMGARLALTEAEIQKVERQIGELVSTLRQTATPQLLPNPFETLGDVK